MIKLETRLGKPMGRFQAFVRKAGETELKPVTGVCNNTITETGMKMAMTTSSNGGNRIKDSLYADAVGVYSQTTEVVWEDDSMSGEIKVVEYNNVTNPTNRGVTSDIIDGNNYHVVDNWYGFKIGDFDNTIINSIGLFTSRFSSKKLICGQIIKDSEGNPSPITIMNDEQLFINYKVYFPCWHFGTGDFSLGSGSFELKGEGYSLNIHTPFNNRLSYVPFDTEGNAHLPNTASSYGYVDLEDDQNNVYRYDGKLYTGTSQIFPNRVEYTNIFSISPSEFVGNLLRVGFCGYTSSSVRATYQTEFDPPIPKSDTEHLTISFKIIWKWDD